MLRGGRSAGLAPLVFIAPAALLILATILTPIVLSGWISLHEWSLLTPITQMKWVGLDNYELILRDPSFLRALGNTLVFAGAVVALGIPLALLLAVLIHQGRMRGRGIVLTVLFTTYVIPTVAVALIWGYLLSPRGGPVNELLKLIGLPPQPWLGQPRTALWSLVLLTIWQYLGYFATILVAGLTQIPGDLYEASDLDGAGARRKLWSITIPLLKRPLTFATAICLINSLGVFDAVDGADARRPIGFHQRGHVPRGPHRVRLRGGRAGSGDDHGPPGRGGHRGGRTPALQPRHGRRRMKTSVRGGSPGARVRWLATVAALLLAAGFAGLPLYWLVTGALKRSTEIVKLPPVWFPGQPSLDAFAEAARLLPLGSAFINSFLIAGVSTAAVVATSVAAGWAFAIYRFPGRDQLFLLLVATMFVPPIATLVPLYWLVQTAGLSDNLLGVLLPQLANAFGIFLVRQFARGVPTELLDAARVDGAPEWRILVTIGVPLLRPAIATLAMFAFVYYWNSYLWPLVDPHLAGQRHGRAGGQPAHVVHDRREVRERRVRGDAAGDPAQCGPVPGRPEGVCRYGLLERGEGLMDTPEVVIAIDLGGTKAAVATVTAEGKVLGRSVEPAPGAIRGGRGGAVPGARSRPARSGPGRGCRSRTAGHRLRGGCRRMARGERRDLGRVRGRGGAGGRLRGPGVRRFRRLRGHHRRDRVRGRAGGPGRVRVHRGHRVRRRHLVRGSRAAGLGGGRGRRRLAALAALGGRARWPRGASGPGSALGAGRVGRVRAGHRGGGSPAGTRSRLARRARRVPRGGRPR